MSTSVVLEGEVIISEEKNSWKGIWRFAKDKKGTLAFEYEVMTGQTVQPYTQRDTIQFTDVSFHFSFFIIILKY